MWYIFLVQNFHLRILPPSTRQMAAIRLSTSKSIFRFSQQKVFASFSSRTVFTTRVVGPRSPLLTGFYGTVFVLSTGLFAVYYFDARSAIHRYFLTPLLRYTLDAETGHKVAVKLLRSGLGPKDPVSDDEKLAFEVRCARTQAWGEYLWCVNFVTSYGAIKYQIRSAWQLVLTKMAKLLTVRQ